MTKLGWKALKQLNFIWVQHEFMLVFIASKID